VSRSRWYVRRYHGDAEDHDVLKRRNSRTSRLDVDAGVAEHQDVPGGDHSTERARIAAVRDARTRHHRRMRRHHKVHWTHKIDRSELPWMIAPEVLRPGMKIWVSPRR
jgi:hypothetical protein